MYVSVCLYTNFNLIANKTKKTRFHGYNFNDRIDSSNKIPTDRSIFEKVMDS